MKKTISWWVLLIISAISYGLKYLIGGVIGDMFGLLGLIALALGIIAGIRAIVSKKNPKVPDQNN